MLLTARRHHRQVIGSNVNTDSNEDSDEAEPESPIVMRAPPVRRFAVMAMVTLSVGMRVFSVVHSQAHLQVKTSKLAVRLQRRRKSWAAVLPNANALLKRRLGKKQASVRFRAPNKGAGHSDGRAGLHIHE